MNRKYILGAMTVLLLAVLQCDARTIDWSGYEWYVKESPSMGPGPNAWSDSTNNVWIDDEGYLHLKIVKKNGVWYCAEVITTESLGYGEYRFEVVNRVDDLDANAIGGLFTYYDDYNEIDIEFVRAWTEGDNANYINQPVTPESAYNFSFSLAEDEGSTHTFDWRRDRINFESWKGFRKSATNSTRIAAWSYTNGSIPIARSERAIMNMWLFRGNPPTDANKLEMIVKRFTFTPHKKHVLYDSFGGEMNTALWTVKGYTNAPSAIIRQEDDQLEIRPYSVDDKGYLGYDTRSTYPLTDSSVPYYSYSTWISDVLVTKTSKNETASVKAYMTLMSDGNRYYEATNAISLFTGYRPESDLLELMLYSKTNRYHHGSVSNSGGMGTLNYRSAVTNVLGHWTNGGVRVDLQLLDDKYKVVVFDGNENLLEQINVVDNTGGRYERNEMTDMDQYHFSVGAENESAGYETGGRGMVYYDLAAIYEERFPTDVVVADDFSDGYLGIFWDSCGTGSGLPLTETGGVLRMDLPFWPSTAVWRYLSTVEPTMMDWAETNYVMRGRLDGFDIKTGAGASAIFFASDIRDNPWLATNSMLMQTDFTKASDTLETRVYLENDGSSGFGDLVYQSRLTNASSFFASGGIDIELGVYINDAYRFSMKDQTGTVLPCELLSGAATGTYVFTEDFAQAYWNFGGRNIGVMSGTVNWAECSVTGAEPYYETLFWGGSTENNLWSNSNNWMRTGGIVPDYRYPVMFETTSDVSVLLGQDAAARSITVDGAKTLSFSNTAAECLILTNHRANALIELFGSAVMDVDVGVTLLGGGRLEAEKGTHATFDGAVTMVKTGTVTLAGRGEFSFNHALMVDGLTVTGAVLSGSGVVKAGEVVVMDRAEVRAGVAAILDFDADVVLNGAARCGVSADYAGRLMTSSNLVLGGTSDFKLDGSLQAGSVYTVLVYGARSGMFAAYSDMPATWRMEYSSASARLIYRNTSGGTRTVENSGGELVLPVSEAQNIGWAASTDASWITITSGQYGNGSRQVVLSIEPNAGETSRSGMVTVAGVTYAISQRGGYKPPVAVKNDFDGDGKSDPACYFAPSGSWYIYQSTEGFWVTNQFGFIDFYPITGDFNGDLKSDVGYYYPSIGYWDIKFMHATGKLQTKFGYDGTVPVTGDFDGDDVCDFGCYYAPDGSWYLYKSSEGFWVNNFGFEGTVPVTGDFDGDKICDFGCYYAPGGHWYIYGSTKGFYHHQFGYEGTEPVTGDFDGDGICDFGCFYPEGTYWYIYRSSDGFVVTEFGEAGAEPITGDYDGDGVEDYGTYQAATGSWRIQQSSGGIFTSSFGFSGTIAVPAKGDRLQE